MKTEIITNLNRRTSQVLKELARHKQPIQITMYGRPAAYLVDVDRFEKMEKRLAELEAGRKTARHEQAKKVRRKGPFIET